MRLLVPESAVPDVSNERKSGVCMQRSRMAKTMAAFKHRSNIIVNNQNIDFFDEHLPDSGIA